jgi:hypothetical protein
MRPGAVKKIPLLFRCEGDFLRCEPGKIPLLDGATELPCERLN